MAQKPVTNLSVTYNVALLTIDNLPNNLQIVSDIFNAVAEQKINVDMISQTPPFRGKINLSFSMPAEDLVKALSTLNQFKKNLPMLHVEVDAANTKISIYGEGMKNLPGVAANLFTLMAANGVEIKLVTTSEVDISYLVYDKDIDKALEAIKREYDLP